VQSPTVYRVTKISLTEQTAPVVEANVTGNPDEDVAPIVIGDVSILTLPCEKVIV
jgi:hypothetical protein